MLVMTLSKRLSHSSATETKAPCFSFFQRLISEVQELKKRLTYLEPEEEDQSDSSEDGYEDFLQTNGGNKEPKEQVSRMCVPVVSL